MKSIDLRTVSETVGGAGWSGGLRALATLVGAEEGTVSMRQLVRVALRWRVTTST